MAHETDSDQDKTTIEIQTVASVPQVLSFRRYGVFLSAPSRTCTELVKYDGKTTAFCACTAAFAGDSYGILCDSNQRPKK